jgi:hypothetical protein
MCSLTAHYSLLVWRSVIASFNIGSGLKLDKNYSKPTELELWLLIWSVTGYSRFGACWFGGQRVLPAPVKKARQFIEKCGPGPFDKILFFDMQTRPTVLWPPD